VRTQRDASTLIVGVLRDVTAEHRAKQDARERQEELAHLARVAMMGDMSASVVHELGQPLNAVALNAQAALRLIGRDDVSTDVIRATLHDIERDTRRAGMVIGQFRHLLRREETSRMVLDVRQLIREVLELAHSELVVAQIDVSLGFDVDAALVMGNKTQLEQVLLNLILNARDAMADVAPGLRHLRVSVTHGKDETVCVSFADSGSGISSNRLAHVFEPFFTSKDHGLGLGLAISRTIMLKHGGDLRAENGKVGAIMHLTFPDALRAAVRS
jgi:C4-dicarboxylate-specific signal transduction histidine kinase